MLEIKYFRAAHVIFSNLETAQGRQDRMSLIENQLQASSGRDVQSLLYEIGVALSRITTATQLHSYLKNAIYEFELRGLKAISVDGNYEDAIEVLKGRLYGPDGLKELAQQRYRNITVNLGHIAESDTSTQQEYWKSSISSLKKLVIKELLDYIEVNKSILHVTVDEFNTTSSYIMNRLYALKSQAESQQSALIKIHTTSEVLTSIETSGLDISNIHDFLIEASRGSNTLIFGKRIEALISRSLPLKSFTQPYLEIQAVLQDHWAELNKIERDFISGRKS